MISRLFGSRKTFVYCNKCYANYALERNTITEDSNGTTLYWLQCPKCKNRIFLYGLSPELEKQRQAVAQALAAYQKTKSTKLQERYQKLKDQYQIDFAAFQSQLKTQLNPPTSPDA